MLSFAERYLSFFLDSIDWIYHCFLKLIICDFHSDFGANLEHATSAVRCHHDQLRDLWWAAPGEIKKNHVSHCSIWAASQVFFLLFFRWKLCFLCPSGRSWPVQIKKEVVAARPRMVMMLMVLACRKVLHHGSYRIWMNMIDPPKVFWRHIFIFQTGGQVRIPAAMVQDSDEWSSWHLQSLVMWPKTGYIANCSHQSRSHQSCSTLVLLFRFMIFTYYTYTYFFEGD